MVVQILTFWSKWDPAVVAFNAQSGPMYYVFLPIISWVSRAGETFRINCRVKSVRPSLKFFNDAADLHKTQYERFMPF
jgi:hypothetical protein